MLDLYAEMKVIQYVWWNKRHMMTESHNDNTMVYFLTGLAMNQD